ncbi:hypothetical protein PLESTB_000822100 [Pleodorina starrii]|uniref:Methyltransferase domain-containing protein n=1 Tax=Pleodorina starrii TaxID=330485 RepID=A0A9W6BL38_9CHLO|nr:hypothetical protein PLESTM_000137600 [Pleodorina starrii]GLC54084.1 hypothetical protein PLESTB_000822100 [Pleodorina starrii]GLC64611.1 hypothetical protein PLESTF_000184300 [Pleodorina starrii]
MRNIAGGAALRSDARAASTCPGMNRRQTCTSRWGLTPPSLGPRDAFTTTTTRGSAAAASPSPLTARGAAGEPSTSGGGGGGGGSESQLRERRRPRLYPDTPSINWDRYLLLMYRRAHEAGLDEDEEGAGEGEEEEQGAESFSSRLAGSDLNAAYFRRWDDPAVHQPLLQDRVLTTAWRDALSSAPPGALEGRVVLDVGCGLGLLSMLAAKAGAAQVIAVDGSSGAVDAARRIIKANGLDDKITVVHGSIEDLEELPGGVSPGGVDVILSNWMGPGLLGGGMINSLAAAVKRWLRPGGLVLPDRVTLWAAGLEDREALQEAKESWSRVAGLDMSAALAQVIKHPRRDVLTRKSQLLSAPQRLASWDTAQLRPESLLQTDPEAEDEGEDEEEEEDKEAEPYYARCPFKFSSLRDERLFGLVLYWEAMWTFGGALEGEGKSPVRFSTHPLSATTHYQQLMLDFPRTMRLEADDEVAGELVLRPGATDPRDIELRLQVSAAGGQPLTAEYRVSHLSQ